MVSRAHHAGHHLAGVDADVKLERQPRAALLDRVPHGERGADGPLGVVLVRHRRAEHGHHRVAHHAHHGPAEADHLVAHFPRQLVCQALHVLGVHLLGERGESGQVGEDHGGQAAFLARSLRLRPGRWGALPQRGAA